MSGSSPFHHPNDQEFARSTDTSQVDFEAALTRIIFFIKGKTCTHIDKHQMERHLWLINVASKRQWCREHRIALSMFHCDLVSGPADDTVAFTQATTSHMRPHH